MSDDIPADETPITFNVKSSSDAKYVLTLPLTTTIQDLKTKLSTEEYADVAPDRLRLIYSGRVLKDPDTLASNKVKDGHTIHLVKGAASNQRQNPANASTTPTNPSTAAAPGAAGVPTNIAAGTGNNPLAGLTGARYAGFAQLPGAGMFGPDGGMGPPPGPEEMLSMLSNPQFASTLNEALSNPQIIDTMIQQNPMLRGMGPQVRQMMQSPEFRRMITDPDQLRQLTQMQRQLGMPPNMFGGMGGGAGGAGGAFPAPGVTDTTLGEEGAASPTPRDDNPSASPSAQTPFNPYAMFENIVGGPHGPPTGAGQAANPFAALFNPSLMGNTPGAMPPSPASAAQETPAAEAPATGQTGTTRPAQQQQPPNPFANFMQNPLFQNPALMQQMLGAMGGGGAQGTGADSNPLAAMFGQGGMGGMGGGGGATPAQDTRPPEERYAEQLRQLNDMGFYEFERNVEALRRTGGSVQGAVEYLLTH